MGLSDGRKSFPIDLAVLIQYRSVIASDPASHVAVAITLNAKASSLKSIDVASAEIDPERAGTTFRYSLNAVQTLLADTAVFRAFVKCFKMHHYS